MATFPVIITWAKGDEFVCRMRVWMVMMMMAVVMAAQIRKHNPLW